jgi:WD40 repeat protein
VAVARTAGSSKDVIELRNSDLSLTDTQVSLTDTKFREEKDFQVCSVAFSPDGRQIAAGLWIGFVLIWDLATGALVHRLVGDTGAASSIAYSADGKQLAVTAKYTTVWDLVIGRYLFSASSSSVGAVFLPGSKLATARYSQILIWDTEKDGHFQRLLSETGIVRAMASLGLLLASALSSGVVKIWDQTGNCVQSLLGHRKPGTSL